MDTLNFFIASISIISTYVVLLQPWIHSTINWSPLHKILLSLCDTMVTISSVSRLKILFTVATDGIYCISFCSTYIISSCLFAFFSITPKGIYITETFMRTSKSNLQNVIHKVREFDV